MDDDPPPYIDEQDRESVWLDMIERGALSINQVREMGFIRNPRQEGGDVAKS